MMITNALFRVPIFKLDFSYDGMSLIENVSLIISGSEDGKIFIWEAKSQKILFDQTIDVNRIVQYIKAIQFENWIKIYVAY